MDDRDRIPASIGRKVFSEFKPIHITDLAILGGCPAIERRDAAVVLELKVAAGKPSSAGRSGPRRIRPSTARFRVARVLISRPRYRGRFVLVSLMGR